MNSTFLEIIKMIKIYIMIILIFLYGCSPYTIYPKNSLVGSLINKIDNSFTKEDSINTGNNINEYNDEYKNIGELCPSNSIIIKNCIKPRQLLSIFKSSRNENKRLIVKIDNVDSFTHPIDVTKSFDDSVISFFDEKLILLHRSKYSYVIGIDLKSTNNSSYYASNAFGATVKVNKTVFNEINLDIKNMSNLLTSNIVKGIYSNEYFEIARILRDEAKNKSILMDLTILSNSDVISDDYTSTKPTLTEPKEYITNHIVIPVNMHGIYLLDKKTNQISNRACFR